MLHAVRGALLLHDVVHPLGCHPCLPEVPVVPADVQLLPDLHDCKEHGAWGCLTPYPVLQGLGTWSAGESQPQPLQQGLWSGVWGAVRDAEWHRPCLQGITEEGEKPPVCRGGTEGSIICCV